MAGGRGKTFQKSAGDKRANLTFDVPNMVSAYSLAPVFADRATPGLGGGIPLLRVLFTVDS